MKDERADERIEVRVNGRERRFREGLSLAGLLERLELDPRAVVVEHNRRIVRADGLGDVRLRDGDAVEVVHFVGGGAPVPDARRGRQP